MNPSVYAPYLPGFVVKTSRTILYTSPLLSLQAPIYYLSVPPLKRLVAIHRSLGARSANCATKKDPLSVNKSIHGGGGGAAVANAARAAIVALFAVFPARAAPFFGGKPGNFPFTPLPGGLQLEAAGGGENEAAETGGHGVRAPCSASPASLPSFPILPVQPPCPLPSLPPCRSGRDWFRVGRDGEGGEGRDELADRNQRRIEEV